MFNKSQWSKHCKTVVIALTSSSPSKPTYKCCVNKHLKRKHIDPRVRAEGRFTIYNKKGSNLMAQMHQMRWMRKECSLVVRDNLQVRICIWDQPRIKTSCYMQIYLAIYCLIVTWIFAVVHFLSSSKLCTVNATDPISSVLTFIK